MFTQVGCCFYSLQQQEHLSSLYSLLILVMLLLFVLSLVAQVHSQLYKSCSCLTLQHWETFHQKRFPYYEFPPIPTIIAFIASKGLALNTPLSLPFFSMYISCSIKRFVVQGRGLHVLVSRCFIIYLPWGPLKGVEAESFTLGVGSAVAKASLWLWTLAGLETIQ